MFDLRLEARTVEPERALGGYFMPAASRQAWWALLLIHHELAQIPQRSADANLRLIRLGWWRETLTEAAAGDPQAVQAHPAIQALAPALSQSLSSGSLSAWLSAWEASGDAQGGSDSASEAGLMRLGIEALGITLAGLEPLAEQTGLAFALARQALRVPSQSSALTILASEAAEQADRLYAELPPVKRQALWPLFAPSRLATRVWLERLTLPEPVRRREQPGLIWRLCWQSLRRASWAADIWTEARWTCWDFF